MPFQYVCADCGTETNAFHDACACCKGRRISAISVIEKLLGPDWRATAFPDGPGVDTRICK